MNIYLTAGARDQIPGDVIWRWTLRSDLTPVPRTVEFTVRSIGDMAVRLAVGNSVWTGRELLEYEIVSSKTKKIGGMIQGRDQMGGIEVVALLKSCIGITYVRERAVVLERVTVGEIYRACGAKAAIADDLLVDRFSCFKGDVPSFAIARALQEESAALVFRDGRIAVRRIRDLMSQAPAEGIGQTDSTDGGQSEYLERHQIPSFYSTDDAGAPVYGDFSVARSVEYLPRTAERVLLNATRVLVVRKVVDSEFAAQVNAGDVMEVNRTRYLVITAAHGMNDRDGVTEANSRFWLGGLPL